MRSGEVAPSSRRELQSWLTKRFRAQVVSHLYDETSAVPEGVAIYLLADPRDIRDARYIGQTTSPSRRLLQHLNTARLWLPAETPWWVKSPKLRPLSSWIRALYRDEGRLPVMVVTAWVEASQARVTERTRIMEGLAQGRSLLNFEQELAGRQMSLI